MITFSNRPLSSQDIIKYVKKLKINHFRGIFSRDILPKKPHTIECGILNLDITSSDGSHWIAFYTNKDKVVYFDSFGDLPPAIELQHYFHEFKILYNYSNYQDFNTFNCDHLSWIFTIYKSITLSLTGNSTILSINYFPSLNVYEDSEIALLCLQTRDLFPNINSTNNRLEIEVIPSSSNRFILKTFIFIFEEWCYKIQDINNKISKELFHFNNEFRTQLSFNVSIDPVDFRTYIKCNGILKLNIPNSIASVFGFEKRTYEPMYEAHRSGKALNLNFKHN